MSRLIRPGKHVCEPPNPDGPGTIWECDCGRRWKYWVPGNPAYEGWRLTWPSNLGIRHRPLLNDGQADG